MPQQQIDKSKKYRTRDGREVRIYAVDGEQSHCVHGAIMRGSGWNPQRWTPDGGWLGGAGGQHDWDLSEVTPAVVWPAVNLYPGGEMGRLDSLAEATHCRGTDCLATVKITLQDGKFSIEPLWVKGGTQ